MNKGVTVNFKFSLLQIVGIKLFNLNYIGRVFRCYISNVGQPMYTLDYSVEGELKQGEFYEEDLCAIS